MEISSSSIPHQASSSPPSSRPPTPPPKDYVGGIVAPSTRKCSCKTSKAEITVSHEGRSPQASGSLGTEHRIPKRSGPSKVVWLVNKPASQSAVLSPFVEAALLEHRVNRYPWQRTIDSSKARLSMGTDISLDIYGPSLAYLAVSEAFQGRQPLEIARHGYHFVHALRTSFEKTEKLLDVGKLSPTCVNSKRCLQGTFYILSLFMNNFNHGRLPYGSKKSPTPQERALTRSEKEALKSFLDAYHGLLDELWADFKAYLRALEQERKKQCSGGNEKPVLKPDEEYLLAEIKKLKLSGVKLKAILDSLMKFACTSSETVVNKLKKTVASEDATSFGSGTLASLRSIGLTSSTTLASSSNDSRVDTSSDDDNVVTLRKSVIILDGLYPDLGITAETSLNRFPNIWDDNMATLGSIISELTDPLKANIESTCVLFDTFFLFFHEFADPENLLDVLKARFVQKQPHNGNASLQEDFETLHRHVQHRVIKLVNLWVRFHWYEARDGSIRHSLYEFLHGLVRNPDDCYFSITILELLPLVIQSDTSITLGRFKEASDLQDDAVVYAPTGFDNAYNLEHHKTLLTAVDINFFAVEGGCEELARAFTLIESDYFHSFLPGDITMWCTKKKGSAMEKWDTFTNSLMLWIPTTILNQRDDFYRARSIMFWIQTAVVSAIILFWYQPTTVDHHLPQYCKDLRNYSTSLSITLALQLSAITRLKKTINVSYIAIHSLYLGLTMSLALTERNLTYACISFKVFC